MANSDIVPGVPETITREAYLSLVAATGMGPNNLVSLRFTTNGIYALAFVRDADGNMVRDGNQAAKHRIFIRVVDSE